MTTIRELLANPDGLCRTIQTVFCDSKWSEKSWNAAAIDRVVMDAFDRISGFPELHHFDIDRLEGGLAGIIQKCIGEIQSNEKTQAKTRADIPSVAFNLFASVINEVVNKAESKLALNSIARDKLVRRLQLEANRFMRRHPTMQGRVEVGVQVTVTCPETIGVSYGLVYERELRPGDPLLN